MVAKRAAGLVGMATTGIAGCFSGTGEHDDRTRNEEQALGSPTIVEVDAVDFATGGDDGDGTFDYMFQTTQGAVYDFVVHDIRTIGRTAFEFPVPTLPAGYWIEDVTLTVNFASIGDDRPVSVCAYAGDGSVTLPDFVAHDAGCEGAIVPPVIWGTVSTTFTDEFAKNLLPRNAAFVGFNISEWQSPYRIVIGVDGGAESSPPSLKVSYVVDKLINIDIKPGSSENPINFYGRGKIPVAILSGSDFDAGQVDPATPTFGRFGNEASLQHCGRDLEDVNGDALPDMVCEFSFDNTQLKRSSRTATLRAQTYSGATIRGTDAVKMIF